MKKSIRLILAISIILILGPVFYFRFLNPNSTVAGWFNDTWAYRKAVQIRISVNPFKISENPVIK